MPDHFAGTVDDIERDLLFSHGLEIVIDDCPRRRVVAHWLAFVEFLRVMQTECGLRLIKNDVCRGGLRVELTERRQIVQHPERTPVRRDHEIVIFNDKIMNRCYRQIQLQWLPMGAIIERNNNAELGSGVKQTFALGIFAHGVHIRAIGYSTRNCAPGFSEVRCFENVRFEVVKFMSIHRHISTVAVVRRRFDQINSAPLRHFRCDF